MCSTIAMYMTISQLIYSNHCDVLLFWTTDLFDISIVYQSQNIIWI